MPLPKANYRHFTRKHAEAIRRRYLAGEKQDVLALEYMISQPAVSRIVNGITWRH